MATADLNEFEKYLVEQGIVEVDEMPSGNSWIGTANTIGAIGLRLGLVGLAELESILALQESDRRLFGQIAISENVLTKDQLDTILAIQELHHILAKSEIMVASGDIELKKLLRALTEFYEQQR